MSDHEVDLLRREFDLNVYFLKENNKAFVDNTGKVAGFLLLALGWLATSTDARDYLSSHRQFANFVIIAVIFGFFLSVAASWIAYRSSRDSYDRLIKLAYLSEPAFKPLRLGLANFMVCVAGIGVLVSMVVFSIFTL